MKRINEGECHWREKNVSNQLKEKKKRQRTYLS